MTNEYLIELTEAVREIRREISRATDEKKKSKVQTGERYRETLEFLRDILADPGKRVAVVELVKAVAPFLGNLCSSASLFSGMRPANPESNPDNLD